MTVGPSVGILDGKSVGFGDGLIEGFDVGVPLGDLDGNGSSTSFGSTVGI